MRGSRGGWQRGRHGVLRWGTRAPARSTATARRPARTAKPGMSMSTREPRSRRSSLPACLSTSRLPPLLARWSLDFLPDLLAGSMPWGHIPLPGLLFTADTRAPLLLFPARRQRLCELLGICQRLLGRRQRRLFGQHNRHNVERRRNGQQGTERGVAGAAFGRGRKTLIGAVADATGVQRDEAVVVGGGSGKVPELSTDRDRTGARTGLCRTGDFGAIGARRTVFEATERGVAFGVNGAGEDGGFAGDSRGRRSGERGPVVGEGRGHGGFRSEDDMAGGG